MGYGKRLVSSACLVITLSLLCRPAALAQVTANVHMSISPGGESVAAIQSGTAKAYAVLAYAEAANTELEVRVYGAGGVVLFKHTAAYDGTGEENVEITGSDILAGYVSSAKRQTADMEIAVGSARQSSSASAKRVQTDPVVTAARTLDSVLGALEDYVPSVQTAEDLQAARDLAGQVEEVGCTIIAVKIGCASNTNVSDQELDSALAQLETLIMDTQGAVEQAVDEIDVTQQWAWPDGAYLIQLRRNGEISDGFDWEVRPDGTPGTPVPASPTPTAEPTETLTPTRTPQPTATATSPPPTATARPTTVSALQVTPTSQSVDRQQSTATPTIQALTSQPDSSSTPQADPESSVATQSPATSQPESTAGPSQPTRDVSTPTLEDAEAYPEPATGSESGDDQTPVAQALAPDQSQSEVETNEQARAMPDVESVREVPLAPLEVSELPVIRLVAIASALVLGMIALWFRARI